MRDGVARAYIGNVRLRTDQIDWLAAQADERVCHRNVIVEGAVDLLMEAVDRAPDLVRLPAPPRQPTSGATT